MPYFLLNYIPPRGHSRSELPGIISRTSPALSLFAPTFVTVEKREADAPRRVERPLFYHYIFLSGPDEDIRRLCAAGRGFSFVIDHSLPSRHVTVPDSTVDALRRIAARHGNTLSCFSPSDVDLQEGDKVEVVTGPFAGLRGVYMSRRGGRKGNVYIAVSQALGTVAYDIPADHVRIIEFAPASRRPYDQLDSIQSYLLSLLPDSPESYPASSTDPPLNTPSATAASGRLLSFTRRFATVRLGNPKTDARLQLLLAVSYRLLGDDASSSTANARYLRLAPHITNPKTLAILTRLSSLLPQNASPE